MFFSGPPKEERAPKASLLQKQNFTDAESSGRSKMEMRPRSGPSPRTKVVPVVSDASRGQVTSNAVCIFGKNK